MKKTFLDFEVEVIRFGVEDIITTSTEHATEENETESEDIMG